MDSDSIPIRDDGLQIDEAPRFQNRFWMVQRFAWVGFCLFILAALIGLTGNGGPFSRAHRAAPGLQVDYPPIARWRAESEVRIRVVPGGPETLVRVDAAFREAFDIISVSPDPATSVPVADGMRWSFGTDAEGGGGPAAEIRLTVEPRRPGPVRYVIESPPGTALRLSTLVLP